MDLDDEELRMTRKNNGATKISKFDDIEILTESILSNCRNLDELQELYIKLQNSLDKITFKRQKDLEGGI